jgi:hypothetical protein
VKKLRDIFEIILFIFVLILIAITIISVVIALAAMLSLVGIGRFIIAILAVLAIIIVAIFELKKTDIPVIDCSNCYKENQLNREIAYFLHAYYPDAFYHDKLTDDDWTIYMLLTNVLNGSRFTVDCNRELFEKLAKNLEEIQMTNTELYRKVREDLKK